jgi:hypothetical protein
MRRARLLMAALLALAALGVPAASAARKHSKRAKISRSVARASSERLVDAFRTVSPPSNPEDPGPEEPALPSFVSASAREFSLTLSRPLVGAGNVRIELRNNGEDPHNLVVSPEGTHTPLASFSTLDPAAYERRTVPLAPGRYQLWCSLESHEALGMSVTLRVQ